MIRIGKKLILNRFDKSSIHDGFNISNKYLHSAELILFINDDDSVKILKNRYDKKFAEDFIKQLNNL
jgi:hypothetical protein